VGSSTINVPRGANVRVTVTSGLGRVNVTGGLRRDGNVYTSDGYDTASERITLRINGGVGSIDVNYR
jgi:predicted membrane protein